MGMLFTIFRARGKFVLIPLTMHTLRLHWNRMPWSAATGLNLGVTVYLPRSHSFRLCPSKPHVIFYFNDFRHATMVKEKLFCGHQRLEITFFINWIHTGIRGNHWKRARGRFVFMRAQKRHGYKAN